MASKKRKSSAWKKRSAAAKKGWATRRAREERDDEDEEDEMAELWGVEPGDVEALIDAIGQDANDGAAGMTAQELRDYIDDLYDQLTDEGWVLDVSDLWDMYYGYAPGAK